MDEIKELIKKYFNLIIIIVLLSYLLINNSKVTELLYYVISILAPFLLGIFIMLLLTPIINKIKDKLPVKIESVKNNVAIIIVYSAFLGILCLMMFSCVPQIITSITEIGTHLPDLWEHFVLEIRKYIELDETFNSIDKFAGSIIGELTSHIPDIITWVKSVFKIGANFCIAIVFAIYLSYDKEHIKNNLNKLMQAYLTDEKIIKIKELYNDIVFIFNKFVAGKFIDSAIVGIICLFFLWIFNIKYFLFLSLIFGITNLIPYFGPLFGYIFGVIVLLATDWKQAMIYLIISIIIQIIDGYLIGPFILKDKIGLSPIWILLSVIVGGAIGGVFGMFLGTPAFAAIAFILNKNIDKRLQKKKENISP